MITPVFPCSTLNKMVVPRLYCPYFNKMGRLGWREGRIHPDVTASTALGWELGGIHLAAFFLSSE